MKDIRPRLKEQGWKEFSALRKHPEISWFENSQFPGCLIRLYTDCNLIERFTGVKVHKSVTDVVILPGTPCLQ